MLRRQLNELFGRRSCSEEILEAFVDLIGEREGLKAKNSNQ